MNKPSNVIQMSRKNSKTIELENKYQVCQLLKSEIQDAIRSGKKLSDLARGIDVSVRTISRLGYGETKDPRTNTLLVLLRRFGYKVTASLE